MDCSQVNQALTLPGIGDLVDGRFRIDRKLGEGGTSTVYEVSHVITDKKFAIKWLLPELALEEAAVDRFIHEARVGGKFAHPHAVQVYDICKASDSFYMLMELLEGESLQSRLEREGQLKVQDACSIVLTCADVLCAAHRAGIIHRDLKPANIFLSKEADDREVTKLLDFGISTFCSELQTMSLTATPRGNVIGTPLYMSPEQMLGQNVDRRADIYALGAVLYELVSGQPPFQADSYGELVVKVTVEARPTPLEEIAPVDRQFAAVVSRAMARRPEQRYSSVEELIFALRPYAAPLDTSTVRTISAAAKPDVAEALPAMRAARGRVGARGLWTGALAVAGAALATLGAHWLEHKSDTVSADSRASVVQAHRQPLAAAPGAVLQNAEPDWEPAPSSEILTGQAPPAALPVSTTRSARAARAADAVARRAARHEPTPREAAKAHAELKHVASDPAEHATTDVLREKAAATPAAKSSAPSEVRIRRGDFSANDAPPKATVSRGDF
ncbi:MAG TPA: serine/threonine-protein kinase [Polyangiales bacterium]|nr:serine/threonine-protein kinase [Polyangiales bacterium]